MYSCTPGDQAGASLGDLLYTLVTGCHGGGHGQEERCEHLLSQLGQRLQLYGQQFAGTPEAQRPHLGSRALKELRRLDRQAATLLAAMPTGSPAFGSLSQQHLQLQAGVAAFQEQIRPYAKENPNSSLPTYLGCCSSEARTLACRLDDLELALDRLGARAVQDWNVDRASAEFEGFRTSFSAACAEGDHAGGRTMKLMRSLKGYSKWASVPEVQALLQRRSNYLVSARFGLARCLLAAGPSPSPQSVQQFLPHYEEWEQTLREVLGPQGAQDWRKRGRRAVQQGQANQAAGGSIPDCGALIIRRVRAYDLRKADMWDDSDPYVVFGYAGQEQRLSVVWNSNSPEWRTPGRHDEGDGAWEEVCFDVKSLQAGDLLTVQVRDYDRFSYDEALGTVDEGGRGGLSIMDALAGRFSQDANPRGSEDMSRSLLATMPGDYLNRPQRLPFVELCEDGSARCCFHLRGEGAGEGRATISFELAYDVTGTTGDPLLTQPEAQDEALLLVGQAELTVGDHREVFEASSLGFFLDQSHARPQVNRAIPKAIFDEVWEYNRLLDQLSTMTTEPRQSYGGWAGARDEELRQVGGSMSREVLKGQACDTHFASNAHATRLFLQALYTVQAIEASAMQDPLKLSAFTYQGALLPSIGEWSLERRRVLRNQVFLANSHLVNEERKRERAGGRLACAPWLPYAAIGLVLVYVFVVCICSWGAQVNTVRLIASVAFILSLVAAALAGVRIGGDAASNERNGEGYRSIACRSVPPSDGRSRTTTEPDYALLHLDPER